MIYKNVLKMTNKSPDCILFAGDPGNADELLKKVAKAAMRHSQPTKLPSVILSDTAVPPDINAVAYTKAVILTDQSDASYYTDINQPNAYALDGVTIAVELLKELDSRGFDLRSRLKSKLLNRMDAADVRRNLIRTMQEDFRYHSSYYGAEETGPIKGIHTVYSFICPPTRSDGSVERKTDGSVSYCQRCGGIFHIWSWDPKAKQMKDVYSWHPMRIATSTSSHLH